jgi:N-acetylglucosaminyldiphosphoundecaprenol N-acetyl-beta-D-mannosaminyltransferase
MRLSVRHLLGVPIADATLNDVLDLVDQAITSRTHLQIGVVNAAKLVSMRRDPALCQDVLSSDIVLADGVSVVWASRLLRSPLPERIAGIDLMMAMLERGKERKYRVYCLGATAEVLARVVEAIARDFPGVVVAGSQHGYFSNEDEEAVAMSIKDACPDILLVAMSSPRKEQFLGRWGRRLDVPVCHGVGGSFDVVAGMVQRAPQAWQRLGLEWLYRTKQEPRRLWKRYLVTNTVFLWMVVTALVAQSVRAPVPGNPTGSR